MFCVVLWNSQLYMSRDDDIRDDDNPEICIYQKIVHYKGSLRGKIGKALDMISSIYKKKYCPLRDTLVDEEDYEKNLKLESVSLDAFPLMLKQIKGFSNQKQDSISYFSESQDLPEIYFILRRSVCLKQLF